METSPQAQLAVLIDADNANAKRIDGLLAEVAKYGRATTKRAYGDWTTQNLGSWKQTLARHAIQPMQQFSNTKGKNSTDSALIIDAMDLLYTERFDGFCIVSSDSDFTRLASRIRESGLTVYGFGERKTPQAFVRACDRFIFVEVLRSETEADAPAEPTARAPERGNHAQGRGARPAPQAATNAAAAKPAPKPADALTPAADERPARGAPIDDPALLVPLRAAVADAADEDGWVGLGAVGSLLSKRMPEFDPRNYGRKKLSDLIAAIPLFEVEVRGEPGRSRALFMREKRVRDGVETKVETRVEMRPEAKPEPKAERRDEPRAELRAELRAEPKLAAAARVPERSVDAERALHAPPTPKPPQQPRPPVAPPAPTPAPIPAPASGHEGERDWAPRRDDRRPAWAIPTPTVTETPAAPAPVAVAAAAAPSPTVAAAAPAADAVQSAAPTRAPAEAPRKAAAKKTVAVAEPAKAAAAPAAEPEAAATAGKPRRARAPKATQPAGGKAGKGE